MFALSLLALDIGGCSTQEGVGLDGRGVCAEEPVAAEVATLSSLKPLFTHDSNIVSLIK